MSGRALGTEASLRIHNAGTSRARDLASVHGSYRSVQETDRAIALLGETLAALGPASVDWLLDKPISNSGRLAAKLRDLAALHGWPWHVELCFNPDSAIVASAKIAVTSDAIVLDGSARWFDLKSYLIEQHLPAAWLVDLREERASSRGLTAHSSRDCAIR
jgi:hypothetical protein